MASAYTLVYYGNTTVNNSITVPDGEANTIGNLTFPGRNFSGYGSPVDQNFLSLLENFASQADQPSNPVVGQFWMDAANSEMCYNGAYENSETPQPSWRSLLYRQIDFGNPANTVTTLAKIGNVVIGNAANTDPNNRSIKFDAGGSGNIATTGNLIIGDNGDGSVPTKGNLTLSDTGDIATLGNMSFGQWYDANGNAHSNVSIDATGNFTTISSVGGPIISTIVGDSGRDANGLPTGNYVGTFSNGNLTATGTISLASGAATPGSTSKVVIGTPGTSVTRDVMEVWGDVKYHGNWEIYGAVTAINSTSTTIKDAVLDIGASENNAPLVVNDGLDRGLALHTYSTNCGVQVTLTAAVAVGDTSFTVNSANAAAILAVVNAVSGLTLTSPATSLSQYLVRVGYIADNAIDNDCFIDSINTATGVIGITKPITAIIPSAEVLNVGKDNIHFIGWDAFDTNGSGEFVFTTNTSQPNVAQNFFNGVANGVGLISGSAANIRAAHGKFEGNVTAVGAIMPVLNNTQDIGNSTVKWRNAYVGNVNATTLYGDGFNITNIDVAKTNIVAYLAGTTLPALTVTNLTSQANVTAAGTIQGANVVGTIQTVAQPKITSVGTLTGLTVAGLTTITGNSKLVTTSLSTGSTTTTGYIEGAWTLTSGSTLEATYADLAERHHADAEYPVGTVMTVGGENEVTAAHWHDQVLGVVSEKWAYLMNGEAGPQETHPAVAYVGRVPVRIIGPVKKGDRISAQEGGVARAESMMSFGWAIETNEEPGEKLVMCIIK